jgi:hypothetical protein
MDCLSMNASIPHAAARPGQGAAGPEPSRETARR